MRPHALLLLAALAIHAVPARAADSCAAPITHATTLLRQGLLDTQSDAAQRKRQANELLCAATHGDALAQYLAGTLYRLGPVHPAHLLPRNLDRAQNLLTAAAMQGRFDAMLELAELDLFQGHPREAMIWAQIEGYYARRVIHQSWSQRYGGGYYAGLLERIQHQLPGLDRAAIKKMVVQRLDGVGPIIDTAIAHHAWGGDATSPDLRLLRQHSRNWHMLGALPRRVRASKVVLFISIGPNGRVRHSQLLQSLPADADAVMKAKRLVSRMYFNPLPAGNKHLRYSLMPVSFDFHRVHLNR